MKELTKYQIDMMRHTVSDPGRNWFGTNYGGKDSDEFEKLVKSGHATKQRAASWMGDDVIYSLTDEGKAAIKKAKGR